MKVVVCIKTPTGAAIDADDAFQRAGRVGPAVLAPFDMCAIEQALRIVEQAGHGEVVVASIGGLESFGAFREALALGAHRAVVLSDRATARSDLIGTSRVLAALLARERADIYLSCSWSGDIDGPMLWVASAERMGLPILTQVRSLSIEGESVRLQRQTEYGDVTVAIRVPCMVEVADTINKPRYPTMKGRLAAKGKPIEAVTLDMLGIDATRLGPAGAATRVVRSVVAARRRQPVLLDGTPDTPERIIAFLEERALI